MTKKQLQQYRWLRKNIQRLEEKILELESAAEKMTTVISGEPRGPNNNQNRIFEMVAKVVDVKNSLAIQLQQSYQLLEKIENVIAKLPERERYLIRSRYIDCRSWEEICVDMGYSWRQVHRVHSEALKMLS